MLSGWEEERQFRSAAAGILGTRPFVMDRTNGITLRAR